MTAMEASLDAAKSFSLIADYLAPDDARSKATAIAEGIVSAFTKPSHARGIRAARKPQTEGGAKPIESSDPDSIEVALLTPEDVNDWPYINTANYLAAKGFQGADLMYALIEFEIVLAAEYERRNGRPPERRLRPNADPSSQSSPHRKMAAYELSDRKMLDTVYAANLARISDSRPRRAA